MALSPRTALGVSVAAPASVVLLAVTSAPACVVVAAALSVVDTPEISVQLGLSVADAFSVVDTLYVAGPTAPGICICAQVIFHSNGWGCCTPVPGRRGENAHDILGYLADRPRKGATRPGSLLEREVPPMEQDERRRNPKRVRLHAGQRSDKHLLDRIACTAFLFQPEFEHVAGNHVRGINKELKDTIRRFWRGRIQYVFSADRRGL